MFQMRFGDLQDSGPKRRKPQPLRNLVSQRPNPLRYWPRILATFALASDHQHQPHPCCLGIQDEMDQFRVGLGKRQAVQVNPRFWGKLAAPHSGMRARIHAQRGVGKGIRQFRHKVPSFRHMVFFTQEKR